jgi:transcriptional regulator with XRE-family HTH domain
VNIVGSGNDRPVARKKTTAPPPPELPELKLIGGRVRQRREESGLTVTALAKKANMDKSQISRLESGDAREGIRVDTLLRIARVLGAPVGWIIANEGQPGPVPIFEDGQDGRRRKPSGD